MQILYSDESPRAELIDLADDSTYMPFSGWLIEIPDTDAARYWQLRAEFYLLEGELTCLAEQAIRSGTAELVVFGTIQDQREREADE